MSLSFHGSSDALSGDLELAYKKRRYGRHLECTDQHARYRDVHVFFGGTGAVGGTSLIKMISIYEDMMAIEAPSNDEVPILVATGIGRNDCANFTGRLYRWIESRHGKDKHPTKIRNGFLTHSGIFVSLERFRVQPCMGLEAIKTTPESKRPELVAKYLESLGTSMDAELSEICQAIKNDLTMSPFTDFLKRYQSQHLKDRQQFRFRSVGVGIPLPSLMAYGVINIEIASQYIPGMQAQHISEFKDHFVEVIRDDFHTIEEQHADNLLIAHTTAVGGMYDEDLNDQGQKIHGIRLGFAHSAYDDRLSDKRKFAEKLTELYSKVGIKMLTTAAAIGVDEVKIRETIPLHKSVQQKLRDQATRGEQTAIFRTSRDITTVFVVPPYTARLDSPNREDIRFKAPDPKKDRLRPSYVIRSGENGFFSVANAEALYRVMRVASASELALVMAQVGLFGDDPMAPWFDDNNICYYDETDNSRQVFDFLSQPALRQSQMSGLEPMALQDLGSAKHQGELHTLNLLILLHRMKTLDVDALPRYMDTHRFDPQTFFESMSRPLTFEDLDTWDLRQLTADLTIMASACKAEDLECLVPFRSSGQARLFPDKVEARRMVLDEVLRAIWTIPSLGSPLIFEKNNVSYMRMGYFIAPLEILADTTDAVERHFKKRHAQLPYACSYEDLRDYNLAVGGFIDLRPHAIVCTAKSDSEDLRGQIFRVKDELSLRSVLHGIKPYSFFTSCGLLALLFRLKALSRRLREALLELGTLQEYRWHMPRTDSGHILLVPGLVEAYRMVSEGLEKATGTERLDGLWGYERRPLPDRRRSIIPGLDQA